MPRYIADVQAMSTMLQEAMFDCPNVHRFHAAAKLYHLTMLTHFPKVTPRIYEHALLVHVPSVLSSGSLLDGSSWFLEAYNKVWKHQLLLHSNGGGRAKTSEGKAPDKHGWSPQAAGREGSKRRSKRPQRYVGLLRSRNTQLCCKVGSGWYGGSDASGILWSALRSTWTGSAANQISLRHYASSGFFLSTIYDCVVVWDTCIQSTYRRLTCAFYVACCVYRAVSRKSDMYLLEGKTQH
jgi:hypothetical protein